MAYQVEYATEQDASELGIINNDSFRERALLPVIFPKSSEPSLRAYKAIHVPKHLADPKTHVLKVTDPASGTIVGYGRWYIPTELGIEPHVPELSEQGQVYAKDPVAFAPQPMNMRVFTAFKAMLEEGRKRHTTERDMMLDILATLPSHQGRGVGSAILRWGCEKADALQVRIYLEATPEGYPLYVKYGWKAVENVDFDMNELGAHGVDDFVFMIRDPKPA
ncbi:hypothetical protein N7478_007111 [Penicillium angulare]|uniref:uncharacterized protein n=1 Tax=Penicillium angulare TaxID=116970 RepID=UPI00253FDA1C|nr:uncharacterized protein N7478_007111 [Penicillium angulare]KAJ5281739.1 hypothetical protein N7478_007111 [Penicillium angulare]